MWVLTGPIICFSEAGFEINPSILTEGSTLKKSRGLISKADMSRLECLVVSSEFF
jgi:hypothetical protein